LNARSVDKDQERLPCKEWAISAASPRNARCVQALVGALIVTTFVGQCPPFDHRQPKQPMGRAR
jgi:hypothetical protein